MWYVVQTTTGKEQELVDLIYKILPENMEMDCFFLKRQLLKRLGGKWLEVTETLFPAYVFLETDVPDRIFYELKKVPEFTKILGDNQGEFIPLEEEEERFLRLICRDKDMEHPENKRVHAYSGKRAYQVKSTKVYLNESGKVIRLEGPLEYFQDNIIRLNLRKRYAIIEASICREKKNVLLGIQLEKD